MRARQAKRRLSSAVTYDVVQGNASRATSRGELAVCELVKQVRSCSQQKMFCIVTAPVHRDSIKKKKKVLYIFLEAALGVEQVGAFEASELCSIEFSNHESCAFFVT